MIIMDELNSINSNNFDEIINTNMNIILIVKFLRYSPLEELRFFSAAKTIKLQSVIFFNQIFLKIYLHSRY